MLRYESPARDGVVQGPDSRHGIQQGRATVTSRSSESTAAKRQCRSAISIGMGQAWNKHNHGVLVLHNCDKTSIASTTRPALYVGWEVGVRSWCAIIHFPAAADYCVLAVVGLLRDNDREVRGATWRDRHAGLRRVVRSVHRFDQAQDAEFDGSGN